MGDDKIQFPADSVLGKFHASVASASPDERATALETYNDFKQAYRAVASQGQSSQARPTTHHFTAMVINSEGHLIELCGCKAGPVVIEENCAVVLVGACNEVKRRLEGQLITEACSVMALCVA